MDTKANAEEEPEGMSFEQFAAVRRRKTAQEESAQRQESFLQGEASETKNASGHAREDRTEKSNIGGENESSGVFGRLGALLQSQELQLVVVVLLVVDFLTGFYQLYASAKKWESPFLRILEYQSGLSLLFFTLEISMVLLAFRAKMFSHFGYTLDLAIVFTMLYATVINDAEAIAGSRLLNVLRLWRIVRMVNTTVQGVEDSHNRTKRALAMQEDLVEGLKNRARKAELAHKRELEKYRRLEQNFRGQREELETLREALHIAAQTVAQVQGYDAISSLVVDTQDAQQEEKFNRQVKSHRGGDEDSDFEDPLSDTEESKLSPQPQLA
mmetsp:Transcript_22588/g.40048  ORF Transcript_22588/g.40048 Transcript_22588/m.40048 type:complete len:327 (+) Transcript_22588:240-1220(+)